MFHHGWYSSTTAGAIRSFDGRVNVGWLPEDSSAWERGIVWSVHVIPADGQPWHREFVLDSPTEAVARFLTALTSR